MSRKAIFDTDIWGGGSPDPVGLTLAEKRFDTDSAMHRGARATQQDAVLSDFVHGEDTGIAILADGMGGHAAGDVASALVVSAVHGHVRRNLPTVLRNHRPLHPLLREAAQAANRTLAQAGAADRDLRDMGSTLIACVAVGPRLSWVSIGDSPLYLWRAGTVRRLNRDHSMGPQIDAMAASGLLSPELAANHPQRNQLTSAITGGAIASIDCPDRPLDLRQGDVLILASDGLQTLRDDRIADIVARTSRQSAGDIARALVCAVLDRALVDQDNVSVIATRVLSAEALAPLPAGAAPSAAEGDGGTAEIEQASDLLNAALLL